MTDLAEVVDTLKNDKLSDMLDKLGDILDKLEEVRLLLE